MKRKELRLQQKCYTWFHNKYPELRKTLFRVENEGKRSANAAGIAKSTGITSGVSDFIFIHKGTFYAIEMKTDTGRLSKNQEQFKEAVSDQQGKYYTIRSLENFQILIKSIVGESNKELIGKASKLNGKGRKAEDVKERVYLAKRLHKKGLTYMQIGEIMNRHYTTIAHYLNNYQKIT